METEQHIEHFFLYSGVHYFQLAISLAEEIHIPGQQLDTADRVVLEIIVRTLVFANGLFPFYVYTVKDPFGGSLDELIVVDPIEL